MKQIANNLTKLISIERKQIPIRPADFFTFFITLSEVLSGLSKIFDFFSDIFMLWVIYYASREYD